MRSITHESSGGKLLEQSDSIDPSILRLAEALADIVRPKASNDALDDLVCIAECGVERAAVLRLIHSGELPGRRLGRKMYVRRSALAALVPTTAKLAPATKPGSPEVTYLDAVRRAKGRGR